MRAEVPRRPELTDAGRPQGRPARPRDAQRTTANLSAAPHDRRPRIIGSRGSRERTRPGARCDACLSGALAFVLRRRCPPHLTGGATGGGARHRLIVCCSTTRGRLVAGGDTRGCCLLCLWSCGRNAALGAEDVLAAGLLRDGGHTCNNANAALVKILLTNAHTK